MKEVTTMDDSGSQSKRKLLTTLAVLIVIVAIVAAAVVLKPKDSTDSSTAMTGTSTGASDTSSADSSAAYTDGAYTKTGGYNSPGGAEQIAITVTLKDGVVTETSAVSKAGDPEAKEYQAKFIGGYKDLIVGKNIDDVKLSRVSGSSLTSQGFNNAIEQIKADAKT